MRLVFDKGTLLLQAPRDVGVLAEIGGLTWDSRVGAWRARALHYAHVTSALSGRGVRFSDVVRTTPDVPDLSAPELRPYQDAALTAWESSACRGVVALPTGSGKTRIAIAAIARSRVRSLILVPTRVLLDQWVAELEKACRSRIGRLGDGTHVIEPVTVATYESAFRSMPEIGNGFELLVVDETHHFGGGMRDEALEMCIAPMRLGLTATPPPSPAAERIARLVGPVCFHMAIGELIGTWLAGLEMIRLPLDLTLEERTDYERWMHLFRVVTGALRESLGPDVPWKEMAKAASRTPEGRRALAAFRDAQRLVAFCSAKQEAVATILRRHRDNKVLVFTADNESAYALAREQLIMPITCDIGRKERLAALDRFKQGELRALVSARVLNEGIDVPDADVAILVGAALGEREYVQRIGRLLRPRPGKQALVYELVARGTMDERRSRKRRIDRDSGPSADPLA